jgi:hypothetical protein
MRRAHCRGPCHLHLVQPERYGLSARPDHKASSSCLFEFSFNALSSREFDNARQRILK